MKQKMNILLSSDRNFLLPTYVTIASLMHHHPAVTLVFYFFVGADITQQDKQNLQEYVVSHGHEIHFTDVREDCCTSYVVCERFPKAAYYRLMAHEHLPETVHRVLYLDGDVVVHADIYHDFYCMDFEGKYLIAASHNPNPDYCNMLDETTVNLAAAARGEYFNSGVLLMNLDRFREKITRQTYDQAYLCCTSGGTEIFYDQGLLNYMFFDKTKYVSSMDYNYRYSIPIQYKDRLQNVRVYKKAVIHYTGMNQPYKPWDLRLEKEDTEPFGAVPYSKQYFYVNEEWNRLSEIWWQYAQMTPVYPAISEQMEVKRKWFRRNLKEFMLFHNDMMRASESKGKDALIRTEYAQTFYVRHFHYRAYKIGCMICAPYFWLRNRIRAGKKKIHTRGVES